ncbi:hypothetical protein F0562_018285 [Nyssa sinensis]|uniref:Integrase catalytic domain-containing protein n=1 Tax=Nyssa sinensis TaxID=561372 RepID=A0A5J4ZBG3_9ASTE|nr:hypothetical protein F0562_018285 [Nyssa sinensis]
MLNGLTNDYKEIKVALRARESAISFEELDEKLLDYETSLKHSDLIKEDFTITAQYSHKQHNKKGRNGHSNISQKQSNYGGNNNGYHGNSDGSGEATSLGHFLSRVKIQHLKSPPHTPEHVGTAEHKHHHVVEIVLTLLHHASLPLKYWSLAFQAVVYLIN